MVGYPSEPYHREVEALRQGLRELGHVEGRTFAFEYRWAEQQFDRFPELAAELVGSKVDVIFATVAASVDAARRATTTIPIVMVVNDPVAIGFVATLARPGGSITGLSMMSPEVVGKQIEALKEVVPGTSRLAVLWNPTNPGHPYQVQQAEAVARTLGMRLQPLKAAAPEEVDNAFEAMTTEGAEAVLVLLDPILYRRRGQITELALQRGLPAMHTVKEEVEAGGLMAYGADLFDLYRRAATYVDKILKGAKPADLPVEQPTRFELVINLGTARALGIAIPPSILARADRVIE